jgi:hypothetical protein
MRNDLAPTAFVQTALPAFTKRERLIRVGALLRQKNFAADDDAQLPPGRPCNERASRAVVSTLHRPERSDIVGSVVTLNSGCTGAHTDDLIFQANTQNDMAAVWYPREHDATVLRLIRCN